MRVRNAILPYQLEFIPDEFLPSPSMMVAPILDRQDIEPKQWLAMTKQFDAMLKSFVGDVNQIQAVTEEFEYKRKHRQPCLKTGRPYQDH